MKMKLILSKRLADMQRSSRNQILERELDRQKILNAELLAKCKIQRELIDEQSIMITEILEGIGA